MKLKILLAIGALLLFNACSKDDDSGNDQILGKWFYDRTIIYSGKDGKKLSDTEGSTCAKRVYYEFFSDSKVTEWSSAGQGADCDEFPSGATNYRYDASAKKLTLVYYGGTANEQTDTKTVRSISSARLEIAEESFEPDYNKDGIDDIFIRVFIKP